MYIPYLTYYKSIPFNICICLQKLTEHVGLAHFIGTLAQCLCFEQSRKGINA